ncbi:MAG: acyltransferase [Chloroflexi bacterium]|nr:acyltransferase [Chloroflexota bacterium]MCC6895965.1 acyltransferase [Anaerolineae bacterium]
MNNTSPTSLLSTEAARLALDTPWKAINEIERLLLLPLARMQCALAGVSWGAGWKFYGLPIIQKHRRSTLTIGAGLELRSTARSNPLGANRPCILSTRRAEAVLTIGAGFGMTGGSVVCEERVTIGDRVVVGANSVIADTDFHPLTVAGRQSAFLDGATAPVVIGDDVFIGMGSLVLKGVTIGVGSVIGAGSVVSRDIPAGVVAAGNPAQVIRSIT